MVSKNQIIIYTIYIIIIIIIITVFAIIIAFLNITKVHDIYFKKWNELKKNEKLSLLRLNWNPKIWNLMLKENGIKYFPKLYKKNFFKLTKDQRKAVKELGYYLISWTLNSYFY